MNGGKKSNYGRLASILIIAFLICIGMYWLPETVFGFKIKKVDLLSDIRIKTDSLSLDELKKQWMEADTLHIDSVALRDSIAQQTGLDSIALATRDSLFRLLKEGNQADTLGICRIEDYSPGHIGLRRFIKALSNSKKMKRPVRIAFLGDSFIEGDILLADFRSLLQQRFGGHGVGFVPMASEVAKFRPTITIDSKGWKPHSLLTDKAENYTLPGLIFTSEKEQASISYKTTKRYKGLEHSSNLHIIYQTNDSTLLTFTEKGTGDTLRYLFEPTRKMSQYTLIGNFSEGSLTFDKAPGFKALGFAMEDEQGITVDNFSLRGNSGLPLQHLDVETCHQLSEIRPYDLIILQYGLNVVSEDMLQYGWYRKSMLQVIRHLQQCFPDTDILLMGVSDRGEQIDAEFKTMPAVMALLHTQRQLAKQSGLPFWNTFEAMGGENSIVRYVENNWASKDYTHMSFRGGREIANKLVDALLLEKEIYEQVEDR